MKINQRIFKQKINPVIPLIPRTVLVEYMNYFLLQTTDKGLLFTYTISDVTIKILIQDGYDGQIDSCIHVMMLKSLTNSDVDLELHESENRLHVSAPNFNFKVPTSDKEFYFNTNTDGIFKTCICGSDSFLKAFKHTAPFSHHESISSTFGVKFYIKSQIRIGATDGKCMAMGIVEGQPIKESSFTIPQHYVGLLSKVVDGDISVYDSNKNAVFVSNGYSVTIMKNEFCKNIPYFFEWSDKITIDGYTHVNIINRKNFIESLKKADLFRDKHSNLISIEFNKDMLRVLSDSEHMGYSSESCVDCVCDIQSKREICLDLSDLMKIISSISTDNMYLYVYTVDECISKPIVITDNDNKFILSPFRL